MILIDVDGRQHELPQRGRRVDGAGLAAATGWTLKPEGLCRDETCVPLLGRSAHRPRTPPIDLGRVRRRARAAGRGRRAAPAWPPWRRSAETHRRELARGRAPALDLQDVDGNPVSFDDLSGHKRVLVTWASWCGCRHELAGWQKLQDELADAGLRLFSVALDDDPEDSRPWIEAGHPTYPVAVDTAHVTAERYGITNVPSVVWVDEDDTVVKPPTIAPGDDQFVEFTKIESERHHERCGSGRARGAARERHGRAARAHRRRAAGAGRAAVAAYLQRDGRPEAARRHLARPRSWPPGTGRYAAAASR